MLQWLASCVWAHRGLVCGGAALLYVGAAAVLWWFPQWVHPREVQQRVHRMRSHPQWGDTLARHKLMVCHRGGSQEGRENTMRAFRHAVQCGADGLELDVCLTRDKKVVVVHDAILDRLTGKDVRVADLDYDELPPLQDGHLLHFPEELGQRYSCPQDQDLRIPLLEEVFEAFPGVVINIECKQYTEELVDELWNVINKHNRQGTVVWGCARDNISELCYRKDPSIPVFCPTNFVFRILAGFLLGFLPFMRFHFDYFEVPFPTIGLHHNAVNEMGKEVYERSWVMRIKFWLIKNVLNSSWMYGHMRRRGIVVIPWVVNSMEDVNKCFELGADGVVTDCPQGLADYIHQWRPQKRGDPPLFFAEMTS